MFDFLKRKNEIVINSKSNNTILENCNPNCPCKDQTPLPRKCPICKQIFEPYWGGLDGHYRSEHKSEKVPYEKWFSLFCKVHRSPHKYSAQTKANNPSRTVNQSNKKINNDSNIIINIGHIDSSTKIIDSMIQRSNIGANVRKCPTCERKVNSNKKFCMDCGAKL